MMGYGFGMIIPLILIGLIIYAVVRLAGDGNSGYHRNYRHDTNSALDVLNERYAKGEISDEEYKRKKAILKD